jgi:hypothetical protein
MLWKVILRQEEYRLRTLRPSSPTPSDHKRNLRRPFFDNTAHRPSFSVKHTVNAVHFGGFVDEPDPDRKKSKNEIIQEIIQKSRVHKAERQRLKDSNEELMIDVDADLDEIRGS